MNKISKKYIGTDQVGSVQLELENALSLRAKSFDGTSSVDLLEYSVSDQLVVQQTLYMADEKHIISQSGLGDTFFIESANSANITIDTNLLLSGNTGAVTLLTGNASDGNSGAVYLTTGTSSANSGSIFLETGVATTNRGDIYLTSRDVVLNIPDSGEFKIFSDYGSGAWMKFSFTSLGQASDAPGLVLNEVGSVVAYSHRSIGQDNQAVGETYFQGAMVKSSTGGILVGGAINIKSGGGEAALISAANAEVDSGNVFIESPDAYVKGTGADAGSGSITIKTGAKEGAGVRGSILLDALEVQCSAMQFKDAADPTAAQDLATKAYVDAQIAAGTDFHKEIITLDATDISNQYVDLAFECLAQSVQIGVGQRVNLYEGSDFSVSVDGGTGGVARVSFTGPSATGGAEELVDGDILYISFVKA